MDPPRTDKDDFLADWYQFPTLVLGVGNYLLGDDGFGPAVIEKLSEMKIESEMVYFMDAGSGAREIIFPLLLGPTRVERIVIIDAVDLSDKGRVPGEVFEIHIEDIPFLKVDDYSMHQIPTSNMLKELRDECNIDVIIWVCQIESIPEMVSPGLSKPVQEAIPKMVRSVVSLLKSPNDDISDEPIM